MTFNLKMSGQFFACGQNVCGRSKKRHRPHAKIEFCVRSVRRSIIDPEEAGHLGPRGFSKKKIYIFGGLGRLPRAGSKPQTTHHPPPPSAHFQLFGGRQYIVKKTSRHQRLNRLTSINVDFVRPDDGDVDLIWRISAETTAKISWGLVTPC